MQDIDSQKKKLIRAMKITKGVRFNASKRLEGKDTIMTYVVAFSSAYAIAMTVVPAILKFPEDVVSLTNGLTVVLSLIILVVSLMQYAAGDRVKADQLHRCALEVNELRGEIEARYPSIDNGELESYQKKYANILRVYNVNHDRIDLDQYKVDEPKEFGQGRLWWIERNILLRPKIALLNQLGVVLIIFETAVVVGIIARYALRGAAIQ